MAKSNAQLLASLQKLYDRRAALDKQIVVAEKNLVAGIESTKTATKAAPAKAVKTVKKAVAKVAAKKLAGKPRGRKPTNPAK